MEPKRCLVLLPVGVSLRRDAPTFLAIYQHVLLPALHAIDIPLSILRGDEVMRAGLALGEGQRWLQDPHLVVAELTTRHSGVIHDLALRDFLADRTVLLSQQAADIPPRFAAYRQILYDLSDDGVARLRHDLRRHAHDILMARPPSPPTRAASST